MDGVFDQGISDGQDASGGLDDRLEFARGGESVDVDLALRDYELLRNFPGFDSLRAARAGEIYLVNASAYFARPGPRIVDSLELLAGILHPKEFPRFAPQASDNVRVIRVGLNAVRREMNLRPVRGSK